MADKHYELETLGDLPELKLIFVSVPEPTTAGCVRVVTDSIGSETTELISHLCLQFFDIERTVLPIDTG